MILRLTCAVFSLFFFFSFFSFLLRFFSLSAFSRFRFLFSSLRFLSFFSRRRWLPLLLLLLPLLLLLLLPSPLPCSSLGSPLLDTAAAGGDDMLHGNNRRRQKRTALSALSVTAPHAKGSIRGRAAGCQLQATVALTSAHSVHDVWGVWPCIYPFGLEMHSTPWDPILHPPLQVLVKLFRTPGEVLGQTFIRSNDLSFTVCQPA